MAQTAASATGSLEQRLDRLAEQLEQRREELHIPGMAIAVVKEDEVILVRGFGLADLENETPVTPETIFAIGSITKSFTATLVGMLVDEGEMGWDDPVTEHIPYFTLNVDSDDENAQVTIRDMLSHRTGFTRMGALTHNLNGTVSREEVLLAVTKAEPWAGLGEKYYYNNVMYTAAGVAAGNAVGTDWDALVAERIFEPLGMSSSNTSVSESQNDPRLSLGYIWDKDLKVNTHQPMWVVDHIGPAAAISSNVLDMAQWVRFQLGFGAYDGDRLLSETQHQETWTSQIEIGGGDRYGLGWYLREWHGQPVIEHGGLVDGFHARMAMLPESNLGFVLLTNGSSTPLPRESMNIVWDALLGELDADSDAIDYSPYLGKFVANFGPFKDAEFTVLVQNNHLAIDVPGQTVVELKDPDEEGKWRLAISDAMAVSFERNDVGDVTVLKIYQSGMTFELPRVGAEVPVEIPLDELQKYLGSYRAENVDVEVVIQNNRLAIDVPGQRVYELYPPDEEGKWVLRATAEIAFKFNESDAGVESMTRYQAGQEINIPRIDVASEQLPTEELNDGSETVCSQEDYVNRVSAADHCLAIDIYTSPARTTNPTLITFVHGDSLNTKGQKYINAFLRAYPDAHEEDFIFIAITRPGYSNGRETSTGQHYYYEGDAFRAHTVMAVSEAIMKLKEHYNAGRLVVMGHSGGANILANGLGYNEAFKPDTAILLSGAYDLEKWAKHHDLYRWYQGRGLSPHEHIESISEDVEIIALTGENDENALPEFARDYVEQLSSAGKNATFTEIRNAGHDDIIFGSVDMWKLVKDKLF